MKRSILQLVAVLAWSLCGPAIIFAQARYQGEEIPGMFGSRSLGRPIAPGRSNLVGGFQTGPSGDFLYLGRSDGLNDFATPWRQIEVGAAPEATYPASVIRQALPAIAPLPPGLDQSFGPSQVGPEEQYPGAPAGTTTPPARNGTASVAGRPASGTPPRAAAPARTANVSIAVGVRAAASPSASEQSYVRWPELSDRLTRIARRNGMLAGPRIDVFRSNSTALLRGYVRTGENSIVLANVIGMEPGVQQVDNGLVVAGSDAISSSRGP